MVIEFLKNSLGRLFILSVIVSTAVLFVATHYKWDDLIKDVELKMSVINKMLLHSVSDRLTQQEIMFKILGQRLLEIGSLDNENEAQEIMDGLLINNPVLIAYGLAKPDGELILSSINVRNKKLPNLLDNPFSSDSFELTLENDGLTIGRTYFFKPLMQWLIPVRYAVRNGEGKVEFVITSAFGLDSNSNPWKLDNLEPDIVVAISKFFDEGEIYYPIYWEPFSFLSAKKELAYGKPLSNVFIKTSKLRIEESAGIPFNTLLKNGFTTNLINNTRGTIPAVVVVSYDNKYNYFLSLRQEIPVVKDRYYLYIAVYSSIYIVFNLALFFTLYRIFKTDEKHTGELKYLALHDPLTDLPNRYYLNKSYASWLEKTGYTYALLFLDLDNFKFINDHFGHSIGDQILIKIAHRLKQVCTDDMLIIRQGGDEFIILAPMTDQQELLILIEKITYRINEVIRIQDKNVTVTGSIGVAYEDQASQNLENLMIKADLAMYQAKRVRNSFAFYTHDMQDKTDERAVIETELHSALSHNEMHIVYQPQIDAETGLLVGVEALIRWQNARLDFVPPDKFIPVAEDCGEINAIGNFVIDNAFKEVSEIHQHMKSIRLSINVSVQQLIQGGFRGYLKIKLIEYQLEPSDIVIEITESLFIEDFKHIDSLLTLMRKDGFSISLDDFGTGYSSLSILRSLPINEVKIDKSFVNDILTDKQDNALIKSIIEIGKSLDIPTLAEGVEEIEQAIQLKKCGCNVFQGYYFSKPMKIDALKEYITSYSAYKI